MAGMNKVLLIGHLGKNPEVSQTNTGKIFCKFSLATTESYGGKKHTEWHNVTVWGKMAGVCEKYLKKGSQVFVEGKINTKMVTSEDGQKKYYVGISATSINFLGAFKADASYEEESESGQEDPMVNAAKKTLGAKEDDVPW